jgi:hypothetical protein
MKMLEQWQFDISGSLLGYVYNDDRFDDGTFIRTSPVYEVENDEYGNPKIATTQSGTVYELGAKFIPQDL